MQKMHQIRNIYFNNQTPMSVRFEGFYDKINSTMGDWHFYYKLIKIYLYNLYIDYI